jgi:MSHA biogenesis protein MshP
MKPFARRRRQARGVAIITAIFLLVAVAGLAVAIVTLTTTQQAGTAQDIQGYALTRPPRPALNGHCTRRSNPA